MIDKNRIQSIHKDLSAVLKKFAEDNNLAMSPFNMTYSPEGFKFAVQMGDKSEIGDVDPVLAANVKKFGSWYDLTVADLGKTFTFNAVPVVFEGMKNKTTVIYRTADGKRYKTDALRFSVANGRENPSLRSALLMLR